VVWRERGERKCAQLSMSADDVDMSAFFAEVFVCERARTCVCVKERERERERESLRACARERESLRACAGEFCFLKLSPRPQFPQVENRQTTAGVQPGEALSVPCRAATFPVSPLHLCLMLP
jgi:hypothetical protein